MRTKLNLIGAGLALALLLTSSTAFAQGTLTPPGAPAPTMKTLAQMEPRTPISSAPFTITQPGSYYLTTNVSVSSGDAITIITNGVTLDLNGFTISSTAASATGNGILINGGLRNLSIANGFIQGGVTNNGSGVYSGNGFAYGINYPGGGAPVNVLVSRISVSGCLLSGISLNVADSTVVESCTVRTVGSFGILASTIKQSSAIDCGYTAIEGDQVSDCRGQCNSSGSGIYASTVENCYGISASNIGISAYNAENCYGFSNSSGEGINAVTILNCYGYNGGNGDGIVATTALNSEGYCAGSGTGVYCPGIANGCYGFSSSGIGVFAFIGNVCHGSTSTGTTFSITHNVNSF